MAPGGRSDAGPPRIAVAGNPNSGKTTVFNLLTGLRLKVANYPGVTVEKREGILRGSSIVLLDLPGAYSLSARSPDEEVARDALLGRVPGTQRPDGVLLVVDASNLERNLYLASQLLEFGMPVVIACNMMDAAEARGLRVDCAALSAELGVPVVSTVAAKGTGIESLRQALTQLEGQRPPPRPWALPASIESAAAEVARLMEASEAVPAHAVRGGAVLWLMDYLAGDEPSRRSAERFLGRLKPGEAEALRSAADRLATQEPDSAAATVEARYAWVASVASRVVRSAADRGAAGDGGSAGGGRASAGRALPLTMTDRLDRVLTHRVAGLAIFAAVMFVLFLSIFSWAEPLMGLIEAGQQALASAVYAVLPEGPIRSLLTDGVIAGVGAVVMFFPQICILFFCLAVLEDSGYMARAAFLMDRLMSRVGLHGRSFIPLLSSYACAIPGIMATRTIENRRDRFTTILIAPLMSCSARLPVYVILIAAIFGERTWLKAGVMFGLYALGTGSALLLAMLFKKTLFAGPRPPFIMELPAYHVPRLSSLVRSTWDRSKLFLTNAGTVIFCVCVIIWALSYFPRMSEAELPPEAQARLTAAADDAQAHENIVAAERLKASYIGRLGHFIEPAIAPLGYDWRLGIGLLSSFLAREVFVGVMGITFAVGQSDETSVDLRRQLKEATWPDGRTVLTPAAGVGLMVFYVFACQCISTLAVVRKETQSWRWPIFMFVYMSVLAYLAALAVYQIGSRWM